MLQLVLDTCTERLIVGVATFLPPHSQNWINVDSNGNHARDIIPVIETLLKGQRPSAIGISLGPGSFTGVRIGLACAKGLAEGWEVPLIGLDNLRAMAEAWSELAPNAEAAVLPVIDARKKKFYGALYRQGQVLIEPSDLEPKIWVDRIEQIWNGSVVVSGYQAELFAQAMGAIPKKWTVLPTQDWTPQLFTQLNEGWVGKDFLNLNASPRYLRLSEAEEKLLQR